MFVGQATLLMAGFDKNIPVETIIAGKFRRYNSLTFWQQMRRLRKIVLPNIADAFKIFFGTVQSFFKLIAWRPDVIFAKGGYVCMPVGFAARLLRIPLVIHDSDTHPGLTNRVLSHFAQVIATGAPLDYYSYPKNKTHYTGIPTASTLHPATSEEKLALKINNAFAEDKKLVLITGGGLGAKRVNDPAAAVMPELSQNYSVVLLSGKNEYSAIRAKLGEDTLAMRLHDFVPSAQFIEYAQMADLVVSRAGMTTIAELAMLGKAVLLIPGKQLTGGHQLTNAQMLADRGAAEVIDEYEIETDPPKLLQAIQAVLNSDERRTALERGIAQFAKPYAARDVAEILIKQSHS